MLLALFCYLYGLKIHRKNIVLVCKAQAFSLRDILFELVEQSDTSSGFDSRGSRAANGGVSSHLPCPIKHIVAHLSQI